MKEGSNEAYSRLLKSELFGSDFASPSSSSSPAGAGASASSYSPGAMSPSKNMLRFKTDISGGGPSSPFSPSILGHHSGSFSSSESSTPPKPPRKVPKTPHKVKLFSFPFFLLPFKCKNCVYFEQKKNSLFFFLVNHCKDLWPHPSIPTALTLWVGYGTNLRFGLSHT